MSQELIDKLYSSGIIESSENLDSVYSDILNKWDDLTTELKDEITNSLVQGAQE